MKKKHKVLVFLGVILFMTISLLFLGNCVSAPYFSEDEWLASVKETDISLLYAPHYDEKNKAFFNPWMPQPPLQSFRMMFSKKMEFAPWPEELYTWKENSYEYLQFSPYDSISFAGHASFIIKMNDETIFTDPFFSRRAAVASKEVYIPFDYANVPERPVILISHNHYDHLDKQSVKQLINKYAIFLVPLGLKNYLESWGADEVYELDWWEKINIGGIDYTFVPAQHGSMRLAPGNGNRKTLWGGWVIEGSKTIYFSGDTSYFRGFEEFGKRWEIDYALVGAGSYEPRWFMHYIHTNPEEFIMAAVDLRAKITIPMHFGAISLSDEPINYPSYVIDEFIKNNPGYNEIIKILKVGEYIRIE